MKINDRKLPSGLSLENVCRGSVGGRLRRMRSLRRSPYLLAVVAVLVGADVSVGVAQTAKPRQGISGQQSFAANCAACHGLDGKGTERAPNLVESSAARHMSHGQVFRIIHDGIPGTGMPAFYTLSKSEIDALVNYLQIRRPSKAAQMPGDPKAGRMLFTAQAGCSRCHIVAGEGGFIASDLSEYSRTHLPEQIRTAIVNPGASPNGSVRLATITLASGEKYTGRVRNEDNFSVQLQSLDGSFHFFSRSDIKSFQFDLASMMPADYGSKLTPKEIDDLVSYLMSVSAGLHSTEATKAEKEEKACVRCPDSNR